MGVKAIVIYSHSLAVLYTVILVRSMAQLITPSRFVPHACIYIHVSHYYITLFLDTPLLLQYLLYKAFLICAYSPLRVTTYNYYICLCSNSRHHTADDYFNSKHSTSSTSNIAHKNCKLENKPV